MRSKSLGAIGAAAILATALAGPVSAQAPEDPLGVIAIPPGEPVTIATWGVQSGSDASLGLDWIYSVAVAVDDRGGELLGRRIEVITEDALCTPEGGATAATKIAANPTVVGLIGSACSDETVGGIGTITNAGLTTISPSNTRPALTLPDRGPEYAGFLRTAHSDLVQGAIVADFLYNHLGLRRAATIHDGSAYAEALVGVFIDEFSAMGGEVVLQEAVQKLQADMKPALTSVAASSPEGLYFPIFTAEGGFIAAQSKEVAGLEDVVLMGSDGLFSQDFVTAAGPGALGMYLSAPNPSGPEYDAFLERYFEKFGITPPQAFHAHGYDAVNILFSAIEQVAMEGEDGWLYVPKGALRDAIFATSGFVGLTGSLSCNSDGDCGSTGVVVSQITQEVIDGAWPPPVIWRPS
jgi:branched-chain amino acid transport system substrate-binding protein